MQQSFFQQSRCTKLSVVVHELGHSFGFRHSGMNNDDYGDETDYMGYAVNYYGVPRKAFNAHKHWLSGWFADRAVWLDPTSALHGGPIGAYLASFVDYRNSDLDDSAVVLIRIGNLFLQFNEGKGYNVDTPTEARDRVIVAEAAGPGEVSQLLKGIAVGQAFVRPGFSSEGHDLVITFCDHVVAPYGYAAISIHMEDGVQTSVCGDPDSFGNAGGLDTGGAGDAVDTSAGTLVFEDGNSENGGQSKENITIGVVWGFVGLLVLVSAFLALRMARERKKRQQQRQTTPNTTSKEFPAPVRVRKCSTDEDSHSSVDRVISGDARTDL
jgi:Gametolysin peptidase M11